MLPLLLTVTGVGTFSLIRVVAFTGTRFLATADAPVTFAEHLQRAMAMLFDIMAGSCPQKMSVKQVCALQKATFEARASALVDSLVLLLQPMLKNVHKDPDVRSVVLAPLLCSAS